MSNTLFAKVLGARKNKEGKLRYFYEVVGSPESMKSYIRDTRAGLNLSGQIHEDNRILFWASINLPIGVDCVPLVRKPEGVWVLHLKELYRIKESGTGWGQEHLIQQEFVKIGKKYKAEMSEYLSDSAEDNVEEHQEEDEPFDK